MIKSLMKWSTIVKKWSTIVTHQMQGITAVAKANANLDISLKVVKAAAAAAQSEQKDIIPQERDAISAIEAKLRATTTRAKDFDGDRDAKVFRTSAGKGVRVPGTPQPVPAASSPQSFFAGQQRGDAGRSHVCHLVLPRAVAPSKLSCVALEFFRELTPAFFFVSAKDSRTAIKAHPRSAEGFSPDCQTRDNFVNQVVGIVDPMVHLDGANVMITRKRDDTYARRRRNFAVGDLRDRVRRGRY
jgi:hypothetical protein